MPHDLTQHETELLLLAAEFGVDEAAARAGLSNQTVKNLLSGVYRKLEARGMAHAILLLWTANAQAPVPHPEGRIGVRRW